MDFIEGILYMIWRGIAIGILISAPMGPVGILCIQRTLDKGRKTGFYTGVGAAFSDLFYCLLTGFGLSFIEAFLERNQNVIQLVGSAVLIGFSVYLFKKNPAKTLRKPAAVEVSPKKNVLTGFLFTFSNPLILFLIIGLFARFSFQMPDIHWYHYIIGYISIFAGAVAWWWVVTYSIDKVRAHFNLRSMWLINRIIGVVILLFALVGIFTGISNIASAHPVQFANPPTTLSTSSTSAASQALTPTASQALTSSESQTLTSSESQALTSSESQALTSSESQALTSSESQALTLNASQTIQTLNLNKEKTIQTLNLEKPIESYILRFRIDNKSRRQKAWGFFIDITSSSYPEPSYPESSYPEPSYSEPSYSKPSYPEPSYPESSYSEYSYSEPSYPEPSYSEPSYPESSYLDSGRSLERIWLTAETMEISDGVSSEPGLKFTITTTSNQENQSVRTRRTAWAAQKNFANPAAQKNFANPILLKITSDGNNLEFQANGEVIYNLSTNATPSVNNSAVRSFSSGHLLRGAVERGAVERGAVERGAVERGAVAFGFATSPDGNIEVSDITLTEGTDPLARLYNPTNLHPEQTIWNDDLLAEYFNITPESPLSPDASSGASSGASSTPLPEGYWQIFDRSLEESLLMTGGDYRLAIVKELDHYLIIYLSGARVNGAAWRPGVTKGYLYPTPFEGIYDVVWFDAECKPLSKDIKAQLDTDAETLLIQFPYQSSTIRLRRLHSN